MRNLFMLISFLIMLTQATAQIINPGLEDWELIECCGQPYINPVGWKTNNDNTHYGFANTPVDKGIDSLGFYAIIQSNDSGIDALGSGEMWQTISSDHLTRIDFYAHCDSIFQAGRCIVSLLGQDLLDVLYIDSIPVDPAGFTLNSINILPEWTQENDSITIRFTAKGNMDAWDEEEDGYSIFKVDNVIGQYITGTEQIVELDDVIIFPNPSSGMINLMLEESVNPSLIEIYSLIGETILKMDYNEKIDLYGLSNGAYVIKIISGTKVCSKILIKQ